MIFLYFSFFWIMKFMQMYFQWNIISTPPYPPQIFIFIELPVAIGENNSLNRITWLSIDLKIRFSLRSTSLRFMFYGNVQTITREEIYEKKVIFFHLALNNITYDGIKKNRTGREKCLCCRKKKGGRREK